MAWHSLEYKLVRHMEQNYPIIGYPQEHGTHCSTVYALQKYLSAAHTQSSKFQTGPLIDSTVQ